MPNTSPATINAIELKRKMNIAKKNSWTNYAFYWCMQRQCLKLDKLEKIKGCAGIKIFMGSSTGTLLISNDKDLETALKNVNAELQYTLKMKIDL